MTKKLYIESSIFIMLIISKLSSTFTNISPFIAIIVIGSYFIKSKYLLLCMIFLVQAASDFLYAIHIANLSVYLAYLMIVLSIYRLRTIFSLYNSIILGLIANLIFFMIANIGHFLVFSDSYTFNNFFITYMDSIDFTLRLVTSTVLFIMIIYALLAVSRKRLAKTRSTRVS